MMSRKDKIHRLLNDAALELLAYIKESESKFKDPDRWVPAAETRNSLDLNFLAAPKAASIYIDTGRVFAALARILEDRSLLECKKLLGRSFYRSVRR